jgi:hypothetical protein
LEALALGIAVVTLENSKTEPIPRIPQNNQGNGTRFGIVTVTPQAGGLRPFIRQKCIRDLEALLIQRVQLARGPGQKAIEDTLIGQRQEKHCHVTRFSRS